MCVAFFSECCMCFQSDEEVFLLFACVLSFVHMAFHSAYSKPRAILSQRLIIESGIILPLFMQIVNQG